METKHGAWRARWKCSAPVVALLAAVVSAIVLAAAPFPASVARAGDDGGAGGQGSARAVAPPANPPSVIPSTQTGQSVNPPSAQVLLSAKPAAQAALPVPAATAAARGAEAAPAGAAVDSSASAASSIHSPAWGHGTSLPLAPGKPVRLGMSAPFSGPAASLGYEFYRGAASWFERVNARGGVHGRRVELVALDDAYDPERTVWNTISLIEDEQVFALFGFVGTPTVTRVLPLLASPAERWTPLLFPFTGARPLWQPRHVGLVYRLRASYEQEMDALVDRLYAAGCRSVGVFYQADAYGREGWAGLRDALARRGLSLAAEASYARGAGEGGCSFPEQVHLLRQGGSDAVVCVGTGVSCSTFIRDLREGGVDAPVAMTSFVDSQQVVLRLQEESDRTGRDYLQALLFSEVVPPWDGDMPTAVAFRRDYGEMADVIAPPPVVPRGRVGKAGAGEVAFEGYLAARLLVLALERMGAQPAASGLETALAGLDGNDLGVGVPYRYMGSAQGLGLVRTTTVRNGSLTEVTDMADTPRWRP